jgi:hypothetical protein
VTIHQAKMIRAEMSQKMWVSRLNGISSDIPPDWLGLYRQPLSGRAVPLAATYPEDLGVIILFDSDGLMDFDTFLSIVGWAN